MCGQKESEDPKNLKMDSYPKFNVDASVRATSDQAGIGGVLKDSRGDVLCYFSENVGAQDVISAEILAIAKACHLCVSKQELKGKKIAIMSDSKTGVSWINCSGMGN